MGKKGAEVRQQIIETADEVIYQRGFHQASFAELAEAVGLPKGNFYYYFKSKDELLEAVIDHRLVAIKAMLADWQSQLPDPMARLARFLQIPLNESERVIDYGCPMGTLSMELGKTDPVQQAYARQMFELFKAYLQRQFHDLGKTATEAEALAMHLLVWSQGMAVISSAYKDTACLQREIADARAWLATLVAP